ncbi:E3 ubiquitin-protein ligase TRIM56-like [Haliotis rufescens]|uniref:E3 ubiquitin-protein ligase TRIM56-like n=1 Tax=Haliotis rufescens TaxID=6454 RepID=UPI001EAFC7C4|nr:E3 ubiquitin-protein ligase TRIM56-like [Haliotis rufescens]
MSKAIENHNMAESIREEVLSCHICLEVLTEARTLPCLHTYCKACLMKMVEFKSKKVRIIRCPECREEVRLFKAGVEDLRCSFFINSLMEIYNTKRQMLMCTVCRQRRVNKTAVSKCTTCGDGLCDTCSKGHQLSTTTVHHKVLPLGEFASGDYDQHLREAQTFPCVAHQKELEYYCETCEKVACLSCLLVDHKDHTYSTIPQAYTSKKELLETMFCQVQSKVTQIEETKTHVEHLHDEAEKQSREVIRTIIETGKAVLHAAEREITQTKQTSKTLIESRLATLTKVNENLDKQIKQEKSSIEFCRRVLSNGKPVEVLEIGDMLRKRLDQLSLVENQVDVEELDSNTRIQDTVVNKKFQGDFSLGIFKPEVEKSVREVQTQTDFTQPEMTTHDVSSQYTPDDFESQESGVDQELRDPRVAGAPGAEEAGTHDGNILNAPVDNDLVPDSSADAGGSCRAGRAGRGSGDGSTAAPEAVREHGPGDTSYGCRGPRQRDATVYDYTFHLLFIYIFCTLFLWDHFSGYW